MGGKPRKSRPFSELCAMLDLASLPPSLASPLAFFVRNRARVAELVLDELEARLEGNKDALHQIAALRFQLFSRMQ